MSAVSPNTVKAPFVWFGGKSAAAERIWQSFGADVSNYVEPFGGSLAVLLSRPGGAGKLETVNDRDCMISNFWRAIQQDPYAVAAYCDWNVSEPDLHARHKWLVEQLHPQAQFRERMLSEHDYCDPQIAGWWVWGIAQWIGGGWCREPDSSEELPSRKIPDLYARGNGRWIRCALPERDSAEKYDPPRCLPHLHGNNGVHRMLNLGNTRRGVHRDRLPAGHSEMVSALLEELELRRAPPCFEWFVALLDRLRRVRVTCGDWSRVVTPSVIGTTNTRNSGMVPCAVFLDAPYLESLRAPGLYSQENSKPKDVAKSISSDVRDWAIANGDDPDLRIAVCGLAGEHTFPADWTVHAWKCVKGYGRGQNRALERIWFSPHCLQPTQTSQLSLLP